MSIVLKEQETRKTTFVFFFNPSIDLYNCSIHLSSSIALLLRGKNMRFAAYLCGLQIRFTTRTNEVVNICSWRGIWSAVESGQAVMMMICCVYNFGIDKVKQAACSSNKTLLFRIKNTSHKFVQAQCVLIPPIIRRF